MYKCWTELAKGYFTKCIDQLLKHSVQIMEMKSYFIAEIINQAENENSDIYL